MNVSQHPSPTTRPCQQASTATITGCSCCQQTCEGHQPAPVTPLDRRSHLLLHLFPRPWQRHYGPEFLALLADQPPTWRDLLDIVHSAGDARVRPSAWLPPQAVQTTVEEPVSEPLVATPGATLTVGGGGRTRGSSGTGGHGHGHGHDSDHSGRDQRVSRRRFLRNSIIGGAATLAVATGVGVYAFTEPKMSELPLFGRKLRVHAADIPAVDAVPFTNIDGRFHLIHNDDGLMALYWRCTHLHCTVPFDVNHDEFACPCHGSRYDRYGVRYSGPAPRPLDYMPLQRDGDDVIVDTGTIIERVDYQPSQSLPV